MHTLGLQEYGRKTTVLLIKCRFCDPFSLYSDAKLIDVLMIEDSQVLRGTHIL